MMVLRRHLTKTVPMLKKAPLRMWSRPSVLTEGIRSLKKRHHFEVYLQ